MTAAREQVLSELRDRIASLESHAARKVGCLPFGVAEIDAVLPGGGLAHGALHEFAGGGAGTVDGAAAALFVAGIAARTKGKIVWCLTRPDLFFPALAQAGLNANRVIFVEGDREEDVLASMEEALSYGGLGAVVGELVRLPMVASRRLQLAAERKGTIALVVRRWRRQTEANDFGQPTASVTRWRVSVMPSAELPVPGVGRARWLLELMRSRAGECAEFIVGACDASGRIDLPSGSADGSHSSRRSGHSREQAIAVIARSGSKRWVSATDKAARMAGVRVGMAAAKAQALFQGLLMIEADPAADDMAVERITLWALTQYSPIVAMDAPDGIVMDTEGADHLRGGEAKILTGIANQFRPKGLTARVAIADTWGAAHACARAIRRETVIVPRGNIPAAVGRLPISLLRLPSKIVGDLRTLGFQTIGELGATPRAPLTLRFGPEVGRRLDQVFGRVFEPIEPIRCPELIEVTRSFSEPIGAAETINKYVGRLVIELCAELQKRGLGARRIDLIVHRVDNTIQAVRAGTAKPARDVVWLTKLFKDKTETIEPGFGIEKLSLVAIMSEVLEETQKTSSLVEEEAADITPLIDIFGNRGQRVYRVAPVASDVPERSVKRIAAASEDVEVSWATHWARPVRLMLHPELVEVTALMPDHPPVAFTWRGKRRRVKCADGPERVFGEWWVRNSELEAVRDYFVLEDDSGERFWVYRSGDGVDTATGTYKWFIQGIFA